MFWKHQLVRIAERHRNDAASRLRATTHWLGCLTITLRYVKVAAYLSPLTFCRKSRVPEGEMGDLVLLLVKLAIDRGSGVAVKRAVTECIEEALRDTSNDMVRHLHPHSASVADFYTASRRCQAPRCLFGTVCCAADAREDRAGCRSCQPKSTHVEELVCAAMFD
jgi:hypothetical protein